MRRFIALTAILLASCSPRSPDGGEPTIREFDTEQSGPGVNVTAAPGVAFAYRYAFRLPGDRIAEVQNAHAQACEKLGLDKCRITGMRYRLVNRKDIQAMLALRLEPGLARSFGTNATGVVQKADGMLVDHEISGEDVGSRIRSATRSEAQLRAELAQVEADLAGLSRQSASAPSGSVAAASAMARREDLQRRAETLRAQLAAAGETKESGAEALAGTPMVFNYGSGGVVPGFDVRSPLRNALQQSWDNLVGGVAAILVIFITLIPWALLAALLVVAYRLAARRWNRPGSGGGEAGDRSVPRPPRRKGGGA